MWPNNENPMKPSGRLKKKLKIKLKQQILEKVNGLISKFYFSTETAELINAQK